MSKLSEAIPHAVGTVRGADGGAGVPAWQERGVGASGGHGVGVGVSGGQAKAEAGRDRSPPIFSLKDPPSPGPLPAVCLPTPNPQP